MRGQNSSFTQLRATSTSTPARRRSPFSKSEVVSPRCSERTASRLRLGRSHPCGMRTSACPRGSSGTEQLYNGDRPSRNVCCSGAGTENVSRARRDLAAGGRQHARVTAADGGPGGRRRAARALPIRLAGATGSRLHGIGAGAHHRPAAVGWAFQALHRLAPPRLPSLCGGGWARRRLPGSQLAARARRDGGGIELPCRGGDDDPARRLGAACRRRLPHGRAALLRHLAPLGPITLTGVHIRLEPMRPAHARALLEAGRDEAIWSWMPARPVTLEQMDRLLEKAMEAESQGREYPFVVVRLEDKRVIGSTRYLDVQEADRNVEIGWTWYTPDVWGGVVNPEAKFLLMRHAFDDWHAVRVALKTDIKNLHSQAAIKKLGAHYEGTLRNQRIRPDGSYRDTVIFSVIESEWPQVKARLEERLRV